MPATTLTSTVASRPLASRGFATRALRSKAARWISPIALLVVWQLASATGALPPKTLAAPSDILATAWDLTVSGDLPSALIVSLRRAALGLLLGVSAAVGLGTLAGLSRGGEALVDPPMQMIRTLPLFGLVPLFILWFGIGETSKIALVALGVVIPLTSTSSRRCAASTASSTTWPPPCG
jgi:sulfonate transport system permease protein